MSLTRTDLEDLTAGTIVEYRRDVWPAGSCIRGPLESFGSDRSLYILTGLFGVRQENGEPYEPRAEITVITEPEPEAEPPLYVNHPRTEPVQGDVVRFADNIDAEDSYTNLYDPAGDAEKPWLDILSGFRFTRYQAEPSAVFKIDLRLLIDGETGEAVR